MLLDLSLCVARAPFLVTAGMGGTKRKALLDQMRAEALKELGVPADDIKAAVTSWTGLTSSQKQVWAPCLAVDVVRA